jgi:hypothetical protein
MSKPNVKINIQDPGLGIVPPSAGKTQVKLHTSQKGSFNTVYAAGNLAAAKDLLGAGPLLEMVAQVLKKAGGPVMFVPLDPTSYGTVTGLFSLTGSGTGTVTGSKGPQQVVRVKIGTGGALGVATYQVALGAGSGGYGAIVTTGADPYTVKVIGQSFTKLAFGNVTYVAGDIYTLNLDGTVTRTGTGPATALDGTTHSPIDSYDIRVKIGTAGALGTADFRYSLDGGNTYSGTVLVPSAGKFVVPNAGIVLTFAGTFTADDVYTGTATPPGFSTTEINAGLTALLANPSKWGFVHVGGKPASAAAAATLASGLGAMMDVAEASFRYVFAVMECPQEEGDATIKSAFASFVHPRVGVVVGDVGLTSVITLRSERRNLAWAYTAGLSNTKLSIHPGETTSKNGAGPLLGVTSLYRDEEDTPGLDDARFVTATHIQGKDGYFITRGRMMAAAGSDFEQVMNRRVMDRFCEVMRATLTDQLNVSPDIDGVTGFILEKDAQALDAIAEDACKTALVNEGEASSVKVTTSRTDNLLSTSTLHVDGECVPKGYTENIVANLGFKNPALAAAA